MSGEETTGWVSGRQQLRLVCGHLTSTPWLSKEGVRPSSLLPSTEHNVCAGISTCWCMTTSDLLDHGHGVEEGGGMGEGVLSWWLTILLVVMATTSESTSRRQYKILLS